jgi:mRNA-degrading endonuclease toxin of MazEF toxin-antitoxin module
MKNKSTTKNFSSWLPLKEKLDSKVSNILVKERDIIWCSIGENIGSEECGKGESFLRPVLVIKKFSFNLFLVVPLTTKLKDNPFYVTYKLHNIDYSAMINQIATIDKKRFRNKVAQLDKKDFNKIITAINSNIKLL